MKREPTPTPPAGPVGRFFHTLDDDGVVREMGKVVTQVDSTHYLLQFFEWLAGGDTYQSIYSVEQMTTGASGPGERNFQFYDDAEHMGFWMQNYGQHRKPREAAE